MSHQIMFRFFAAPAPFVCAHCGRPIVAGADCRPVRWLPRAGAPDWTGPVYCDNSCHTAALRAAWMAKTGPVDPIARAARIARFDARR